MSITGDTVICSTQTQDDNKQIPVVFDRCQQPYQLLTWHCCQIEAKVDQQLIILVSENESEHGWMGTLTTTTSTAVQGGPLIWTNNWNDRAQQLYLSDQADSPIIYFEVPERTDSPVSTSAAALSGLA